MTQNASTTGPLIIQSDHTFMLETAHPQYADCRDFLALFAELVKSPEFIHTYRVTPLSMWNAAARLTWRLPKSRMGSNGFPAMNHRPMCLPICGSGMACTAG